MNLFFLLLCNLIDINASVCIVCVQKQSFRAHIELSLQVALEN